MIHNDSRIDIAGSCVVYVKDSLQSVSICDMNALDQINCCRMSSSSGLDLYRVLNLTA